MDLKELSEKLNFTVLNEGDLSRTACGCYCGDLLSWVMSRAEEGNVWITVMGNVNSIGVAVLADVSCIVLAENSALDDDALMRAKQNDVTIFRTDKNTYQTAVAVSKLI